jgi:hypothetical protein
VTKGSIRLALFARVFLTRQLRAPLVGFVGLGPGFVEGHKLLQRFDGVGVFGAELGLAAADGTQGTTGPSVCFRNSSFGFSYIPYLERLASPMAGDNPPAIRTECQR